MKTPRGTASVVVFVLALCVNVAYAQRPVIASFSSQSDTAGATVTIQGQNFGLGVAANAVFFGGIPATINSATSTSLIVVVPKGAPHEMITVTNLTTRLTGYSRISFRIRYPVGGISFEPFRSYQTAISLSVADFNKDNKPDISAGIAFPTNPHLFRAYQNTSPGPPSTTISFDSAISNTFVGNNRIPSIMAKGDFDGDGKIDIAVMEVHTSQGRVLILQNTTAATNIQFTLPAGQEFALTGLPSDIAVGDLNGDGKPDVAVSLDAFPKAYILRNNTPTGGAINFIRDSIVTSGSTKSVAIGFLDGDDIADLVVADRSGGDSVAIYLGRTTGSPPLLLAKRIGTANSPDKVRLGNVDGDSLMDIGTTVNVANSPYVTILRNNGGLNFSRNDFFVRAPGGFPTNLTWGELSGDGKADIVVTTFGVDSIFVLENNSNPGTTNFLTRRAFRSSLNPNNIPAIGDFDGDGKPDIAIAGGTAGQFNDFTRLVVLRNNSVSPAFVVVNNFLTFGSVTPDSLAQQTLVVRNGGGAPLVISSASVSTGSGFGVTPTGNITILPDSSRQYTVTFSPMRFGSNNTDSLVFTHNATPSRDTINLFGTGRFPRPIEFRVTDSTSYDAVRVKWRWVPVLPTSPFSNYGIYGDANPNPTTLRGTTSPSSDSATTITGLNRGSRYYFVVRATTLLSGVTSANSDPTSVVWPNAVFATNTSLLDFGTILFGTKRDSVSVRNTGTTLLRVDSMKNSDTRFSVEPPMQRSIASNDSSKFYISFTTSDTLLRNDTVRFFHNGSNVPTLKPLRGRGTSPANAAFVSNPSSLSFDIVAVDSTKLDTIVVTNPGGAQLTITNVSSNNAQITVSPVSANLPPTTGRQRFDVRFRPSALRLQSGTITFAHNASGSPSTVPVSGTGRLSAPSPLVVLDSSTVRQLTIRWRQNRQAGFLHYRVFRGTAPNPATQVYETPVRNRTDTTRVDTGLTGGTRYYYVVTTVDSLLAESSRSNEVSAQVRSFVAPTITNPSATVRFTSAILTARINPNGSATSALFEWGTDSLLASPNRTPSRSIGSVTTNVTVTDSIAGLSTNTKYFFRAVAGTPPVFGGMASFTTLSTIVTVTGTISFTASPTLTTDYRLVSLPGAASSTVGDFVQGAGSGQQNIDWRVFKYSTAGAQQELFSTSDGVQAGEGVFLIRKGSFSVTNRSTTLPNLASDGTTSILLHAGWNIIANPFHQTVQWMNILNANSLPLTTERFEYLGGYDSVSLDFQPLHAYFFFNATNLSSLKIPYPFSVAAPEVPPFIGWRVQLKLNTALNNDQQNYLGISPGASIGLDTLESRKPPFLFDQNSLSFQRREWDARYPSFGEDYRPELGEGQVWDFVVETPAKQKAKLTLAGVDQVPPEFDAVLVNLSNTNPVDVRQVQQIEFTPVKPTTQFKFIVGTPGFIAEQTSKLLPARFALLPNYPNPFNPVTTIEFHVPKQSVVSLKIIDILGREVETLVNDEKLPGVYSILWNAANYASGVYFYQMSATGFEETRKLLLVR